MTQPPQPGWYPDHTMPGTARWFDGANWTMNTAPAPTSRPRRPAIFGPLLMLAGVAVLVFLLLTHPSVSVPLAGVQDCGATSIGTALAPTSVFSGSDPLDRDLDQECRTEGRSNVAKGVGALVLGFVAGGLVTAYERRR